MKDTIFEYTSYKRYLSDLIRSGPKGGRGMKSALAKAAQCQSTYISQVLSGDRDFNLEQAELINLFLGHSADEARYFILLVSRERAGIPALKARLDRELQIEVDKQHNLKNRLNAKKEQLDPEVQAHYYRSWYITAVHVCLTLSHLRTKEAISKALSIPIPQVSEALEFLVSAGLARKVGNEYETGQNVVFVGKDSPFLTHHHINWRQQAIRSAELNRKEDVHYSSVFSISARDVKKLRTLILQTISEASETWKNSTDEEELHSFCIDFFRVDRQE
jgi:uncharacterized protein (TIGR02147 family)